MNWKSLIPNAITLGNLLCGVGSIYAVSQDSLISASLFILAAAVLDFFDGFAARALKVSGELGTQLDSLADVVSFGVAPSFIAAHLAGAFQLGFTSNYIAFTPFLMAPFSAYRLAKFNLDSSQSTHFKGLPTPANALFWLSIPLITNYGNMDLLPANIILYFSKSTLLIAALSLLTGVLMISNYPLLALKFKTYKWADNKWKYILILSSLTLLAIFQLAALPIILLLYLIISSIYFYRS